MRAFIIKIARFFSFTFVFYSDEATPADEPAIAAETEVEESVPETIPAAEDIPAATATVEEEQQQEPVIEEPESPQIITESNEAVAVDEEEAVEEEE